MLIWVFEVEFLKNHLGDEHVVESVSLPWGVPVPLFVGEFPSMTDSLKRQHPRHRGDNNWEGELGPRLQPGRHCSLWDHRISAFLGLGHPRDDRMCDFLWAKPQRKWSPWVVPFDTSVLLIHSVVYEVLGVITCNWCSAKWKFGRKGAWWDSALSKFGSSREKCIMLAVPQPRRMRKWVLWFLMTCFRRQGIEWTPEGLGEGSGGESGGFKPRTCHLVSSPGRPLWAGDTRLSTKG